MRSTNQPKEPPSSQNSLFSFFCSYLLPSAPPPKEIQQYPECLHGNMQRPDQYECIRQRLNQDATKAYEDLVKSSKPLTVFRRS